MKKWRKMRVIAGTARSIPLVTPEGMDTRPTTDRIKETLFNVLQFELANSCFLDIFAGSGAIGIEALSRGSEKAFFIDSSRQAAACIEKNIKKCHFESKCSLIQSEAVSGLNKFNMGYNKEDFDRLIVFMDPPYDKGLEYPVLKALMDLELIDEESIIIVETSLKADMSEALKYGYEIYKEKKYKNQKHVFLRKG